MIRIEQLIESSSQQCKAFFSNGEEIEFTRKELCAFHISPGNFYTKEEYENLIEKIFCERAKSKVMPYVVFSRKTGRQVYNKIISLGFDEHTAILLLNELIEKEYINDRDYCLSYIKKSSEIKNYSQNRIRMELKQKGIDEHIIEELLNELSVDDIAAANRFINKKLRTGGERDYNKLYAILIRKGFTGETARKVLQEINFEN